MSESDSRLCFKTKLFFRKDSTVYFDLGHFVDVGSSSYRCSTRVQALFYNFDFPNERMKDDNSMLHAVDFSQLKSL